MFRLIAKALGEKASTDNHEADKVAWIRVILILQAVITNVFIISGVIRQW